MKRAGWGFVEAVREMTASFQERGPQNLETILTLSALKIRFPTDFYILRGNHECQSINRVYGFYDEIRQRYNESKLYDDFNVSSCFFRLSN